MIPPSLQFLVALAAKGTVLLLATTLAAGLAHRARASVRHAIWAAGLTGLLLIPALSIGLPQWEVVPLPELAKAGPALNRVSGNVSAREAAPSPGGTAGRSTGMQSAGAAVSPSVPPGASAKSSVASGIDLATAIIVTWMSGAGLLLGWLLFGHVRVWRIVRAAGEPLSPEWQRSVDGILAQSPLGFRVRFLQTRSTMPMAAGVFHPVVLLPGAGADWTAAHRRDVLVHELAHVRRRDCLTHLASRIACALHWFNPLAWLAARQARVEREHACDDAVLAAGALPSSYAQALLETARTLPTEWATASAGLAMARPSHLANRLLAVLDPRRSRGRLGRVAFGAASFGTLALLAPVAAMAPVRERTALPSKVIDAPRATPPAGVQPGRLHVSEPASTVVASAPGTPLAEDQGPCTYTKNGSHRTVRLTNEMRITGMGSADDGKGNAFVAWTGADCSVVIHVVGDPSFTSDESDVASFKGSGRFTVTEVEDRTETVYDVRGDGASLERSYTVDRAAKPISDEERRWVATMVVEYMRQSGYQAEQRAQRILKASGVPGLLEEIAAIRSDYGRSRYYLAGMVARQGAGDIRLFLDHAAGHLDSDYEKGRVLAAVPASLLGEPGIRTSFLGVTRSIDSDYEKARALVTISGAGLDAPSIQTALTAATTISSAYERSRVLQAVSKNAPAGDLDPLYFEAVTGIDSDYEKGRVLAVYAAHGNLGDANLGRLYATATTISSSNELANLLISSIGSSQAVSARCAGYLAAAAKIDSDFDRARTLLALQGAAALTPACANAAADVAGSIQSSNDRARVLIDFAGRGLLTEATRVAFFRAAHGTDSSYDLRRVLTAVLAQAKLPLSVLGDLLDTAGAIDSDNDLASVLVAAAGTGQVVGAVRPAYLRAAGRLSSDYEKRRALSAIGAQ